MTLLRFSVSRRTLAILVSLTILCAASARAGTIPRAINVDFGTVNPASPLFTGVGVDPDDDGIIWNAVAPGANAAVVVSNLVDSVGNVTTAGLSVSGVTAVSTPGGSNPTDNALLQDYLVGQVQGQDMVITVTNLIPFESYRVYLYGAGRRPGAGETFHIGGISATTNGAARGNTFVQGENYAVLPTNVDDRGTLTLRVVSNSSTELPVINGLQIQANAIPPTTSPSFTDAFDVSQGTVIIGGTPTEFSGLEPAIGGRSVDSPEPENVLFAKNQPPGTVHSFEFRMPSKQTIQSINIFANYNDYISGGLPGNIDIAGANRMTLWAYDEATQDYTIKAFEIFPANPYNLTLAPPGAAVQSDGAPSLLVVTANITPVTTDRFKMELYQAGDFGVRFAELDGFTTPNPGLAISAPVITTATTTTGQVGTLLSYQLAASNGPISYFAAGLPDGLSLDPVTGTIKGTPTAPGDFDAAVAATNAGGEGPVAGLRFTITGAAENIQGISLLSPPAGITVVQNQTIEIDASVLATPGTIMAVDFEVIDGDGNSTPLLNTDGPVARAATSWQPTETGVFTLKVTATDTLGTPSSISQLITVASSATNAAPIIDVLSGVGGQTFALGSSIEVIAAATDADGNPLDTVQFYLDGQPIPTTITTTDASGAQTSAKHTGAGRHIKDAASGQQSYAHAQLPVGKITQLLTAAVANVDGVVTVTPGTKIEAKAASTEVTTYTFHNPDGTVLGNGGIAPATVGVAAVKATGQIVKMEFFVDAQSVGPAAAAAPYVFTLPALTTGQHVLTALATDDAGVSSLSPPVIVHASDLPVVNVAVTKTPAVTSSGSKGIIVISIPAALTTPLVVNYKPKGSAVPGDDYATLTGMATIDAGFTHRKIKIKPRGDLGGAGLKVVKVKLLPGDGYTVGAQTLAKVKIVEQE